MNERRALVLLHGLWLGGRALGRLQHNLRVAGRSDSRVFAWSTVRRGLAENVGRLREFAEQLDADHVDWIGHSLGGVLVLRTLSEWPDRPPGRIVCLGSPLTGSRTGARLARPRLGRRLIGPSIVECVLDSSADEWCSATVAADTGVIAGRMELGAGRLIGRLDPPHDGTVTVAETRLCGIADHLVLNVSHSGLLFSPAAARAAAVFLRAGRFPQRER